MKIDPKEWDPPEYLPISSRNFLIDRAQTMHHVQQAAYLTMGQILLQVREKFKSDPKLDGWWTRWVEEATPITHEHSTYLIKIAQACKDVPGLSELTSSLGSQSAATIARLPNTVRKDLVDHLRSSGTTLSHEQLRAFSKEPEVELEAVEEDVQRIQTKLAELKLTIATASDPKSKHNAQTAANRQRSRLDIALQRLSEARQKVNNLEKERSTQELVMEQLQAQLRQQQLKVEEMSLDPKAKRKRAVARTIVDATTGLDLLLSSIDKYQVDKDDIGAEAVKTIERKMAQVKAKLLELHYQDEWVESANTP